MTRNAVITIFAAASFYYTNAGMANLSNLSCQESTAAVLSCTVLSQQHPEVGVCSSIAARIVLRIPMWSGTTPLTAAKLTASPTEDHIQVS